MGADLTPARRGLPDPACWERPDTLIPVFAVLTHPIGMDDAFGTEELNIVIEWLLDTVDSDRITEDVRERLTAVVAWVGHTEWERAAELSDVNRARALMHIAISPSH